MPTIYNRWRFRAPALVLLAGCAAQVAPADGRLPVLPAISGTVAFPGERQAQATTTEIGTAATVSLIDPTTNVTVATTLSTPARTFVLKISGLSPESRAYYLEAIKGLRSNAAGNDAVRMRTLVKYIGPALGWQSISVVDASISPQSTALAAIMSLRATSSTPVVADSLIGARSAFQDALPEPILAVGHDGRQCLEGVPLRAIGIARGGAA
ncbi:MAG: hypothetical protein FJZ01_09270 [Candidatus Sericytochromatia bacterium]|nr:hypothetical protein [Candidatus Tanganyikabacteria bacterium]